MHCLGSALTLPDPARTPRKRGAAARRVQRGLGGSPAAQAAAPRTRDGEVRQVRLAAREPHHDAVPLVQRRLPPRRQQRLVLRARGTRGQPGRPLRRPARHPSRRAHPPAPLICRQACDGAARAAACTLPYPTIYPCRPGASSGLFCARASAQCRPGGPAGAPPGIPAGGLTRRLWCSAGRPGAGPPEQRQHTTLRSAAERDQSHLPWTCAGLAQGCSHRLCLSLGRLHTRERAQGLRPAAQLHPRRLKRRGCRGRAGGSGRRAPGC